MVDGELIALFEQRNEHAVEEIARQYGALCRAMAYELTGNQQDAEEICNDVWLAVWNQIPPQKPEHLLSYLAEITRKQALKRLRLRYTQRRGSGVQAAVLDELSECIPASENVEKEIEHRMVTAAVNRFLSDLPEQQCAVFVLRYTYGMPVKEIAKQKGMTANAVKVLLHRTRNKLKDYLKEEGLL